MGTRAERHRLLPEEIVMTQITKKRLDTIAFTAAVLALGSFLTWVVATSPGQQ